MSASSFQAEIAEHILRIDHRFSYIRTICADYILDDFSPLAAERISVTETDIAAEQKKFTESIPPPYAEALALERATARVLAPGGVAHMHAVALAVDSDRGREAYLFLADSGAGKSTHVRHWLKMLGDRAFVVADDKPFLSFAGDTLLVHGSPWRGKEGWGRNVSVPVRAVGLFRRATEDTAVPASPTDAMEELFRRLFLPEDPDGVAAVLTFADRVLTSIPFWCISCTDSPHAARVAYSAMAERS